MRFTVPDLMGRQRNVGLSRIMVPPLDVTMEGRNRRTGHLQAGANVGRNGKACAPAQVTTLALLPINDKGREILVSGQ